MGQGDEGVGGKLRTGLRLLGEAAQELARVGVERVRAGQAGRAVTEDMRRAGADALRRFGRATGLAPSDHGLSGADEERRLRETAEAVYRAMEGARLPARKPAGTDVGMDEGASRAPTEARASTVHESPAVATQATIVGHEAATSPRPATETPSRQDPERPDA